MTEPQDQTAAAFEMAADWYIDLREHPDDAVLRDRFSSWLAETPENEAAWLGMRHTVAAIELAPAVLHRRWPRLSKTRTKLFRRAARGPRPEGRPRRLGRAMAVSGIAACLVVAVAAVPSVVLLLAADHATASGEVEIVPLPDGSTAVLGPDSAIRVDFADGERTVELLSGQAKFDVRRDPARPFIVAAHDVKTTVLGTAFDVRMLGEVTRVGVEHGHVRVEANGPRPVTQDLSAGEWLQVGGRGVPRHGSQDPAMVGAWRDGRAFVRNRPISEVINEIRPWHRGSIVLAGSKLGRQTVTGIYDLNDPTMALKLIVSPHGGQVIRVTPWLLIVTN